MNLGASELLILLVVGAVVVAVIFAVMQGGSSGASASPPATAAPFVPVVVGGSPDQVMIRIVHLLIGNGATVTFQSSSSLSGHVLTKRKPSVLVAILLWFICVVPMIIYLINGSKDVQEPFAITLTPVDGGTRVEGSGSGRGQAAVSWVTSQLAGVSAASPSASADHGGLAELGEPSVPPQASANPPVTPEGWYADPQGVASLRWWDGGQWTDHTR